LNETAPTARASAGDDTDDSHPAHRRGHRGGGGGPVRLIGGMIGGLFGR
jgi:hypothetical protein